MRYTVDFNDGLPQIEAEVDGDYATFDEALLIARLNLEDLYLERMTIAKSDYEDGMEHLEKLKKPEGGLRICDEHRVYNPRGDRFRLN